MVDVLLIASMITISTKGFIFKQQSGDFGFVMQEY